MKPLPPLPCTYCPEPAQWVITGEDPGYWSAGACQRHKARAEARAAQAGRVTTERVTDAPEPNQPDLFTTTEEGTPE